MPLMAKTSKKRPAKNAKKKINMPRLKDRYQKEVIPEMMKRFGYKSVMAVPKIEKIVVNVGSGRADAEPKLKDMIQKDIAAITGQKPAIRNAVASSAV